MSLHHHHPSLHVSLCLLQQPPWMSWLLLPGCWACQAAPVVPKGFMCPQCGCVGWRHLHMVLCSGRPMSVLRWERTWWSPYEPWWQSTHSQPCIHGHHCNRILWWVDTYYSIIYYHNIHLLFLLYDSTPVVQCFNSNFFRQYLFWQFLLPFCISFICSIILLKI